MSAAKAPVNPNGIVTIEGDCARPKNFSFHDLQSLHPDYQVPDVSKIDARLKGGAVRLRALLDVVGPDWKSDWLTIESEDGHFCVSLPLADTRSTALVIYSLNKKPMDRKDGGPVRFCVPFHPDDCTKVKGATRLVVSAERGKDTRPSNAAEHKEHHARHG